MPLPAPPPQDGVSTNFTTRAGPQRYGETTPSGNVHVCIFPDPTNRYPISVRLNQYIARSGICSRREADALIAAGEVMLNGKTVTEMGIQVGPKDKVSVKGAQVNPEAFAYILLNKPKDTITTTDDDRGRKTVMDLIEEVDGLRLYPVGRLDRNTTGVLLMTNDGDLAHRLMHPSYQVRKRYDVETRDAISDEQIAQLRKGVALEDGPAKAYFIERLPGASNQIRLSIHEGRNRQVRRMIEAVGHDVVLLHRSDYAGLSVKGIRPGRWRKLSDEEVNHLRSLVKLFVSETKKTDGNRSGKKTRR